jgi:hypothetical protein
MKELKISVKEGGRWKVVQLRSLTSSSIRFDEPPSFESFIEANAHQETAERPP